MHSSVWGARAPRSGWATWIRWSLGGAVIVLLGTFVATGAVAWHEDYRLYAVRTGSMAPGLPVGSLLIDAPAPDSYHRGDVVTIKRPQDVSNPVVTHRVLSVSPAGLRTKGDANPDPDVFVAKPSDVVGEVVHHIPYGGYVLVYLSQLTGVLSLMTVALTLYFAWGLCFPTTTSAPAAATRQPRIPRQRQAVAGEDAAPVPSAPATVLTVQKPA